MRTLPAARPGGGSGGRDRDLAGSPPLVTDEGIEPYAATGVRALHSRVAWFYGYTGVTPAMCMRLTGVGSQYIFAFRGADGNRLDGGRTYRMTLPIDIPATDCMSKYTGTMSAPSSPSRIQ